MAGDERPVIRCDDEGCLLIVTFGLMLLTFFNTCSISCTVDDIKRRVDRIERSNDGR